MESARVGVRLAAVVMAAGLVMGVTGCAGSQYTYVRDDDGQAYFKIPTAWQKVDQKALDVKIFGDPAGQEAQQAKQSVWAVAYDASASPSADHLLGGATGSSEQPFALAMVRPLSEEEHNKASLDYLRNALIPVVDISSDTTGTSGFTQFQMIKDEELPQHDGISGIHVVFNASFNGGALQTFDKTTYLSGGGSKLSALLIQCSATCYRAQADQIANIAHSFKIKPTSP
jgi:hypothetical protein